MNKELFIDLARLDENGHIKLSDFGLSDAKINNYIAQSESAKESKINRKWQ